MARNTNKFWAGLAIGALSGAWITRWWGMDKRMPNARSWQRILSQNRGEVQAAAFMRRVEERYQALKRRRPVFDRPVYNLHVTAVILPGLALYQVWREDEAEVNEALAQIDALFESWVAQIPPFSLRLEQVLQYVPENFTFFRRLVRFIVEVVFPSPGWQYTFVDDSDASLAFDIHHCFYLDVLNTYGAPELTPVFCRLDDYVMDALPGAILWGRTQTIGMGAPYCNFRWDYAPEGSANRAAR